ncbi:unnamed protein product, partial [Ectocarpus sp. 6 AP-2014]
MPKLEAAAKWAEDYGRTPWTSRPRPGFVPVIQLRPLVRKRRCQGNRIFCKQRVRASIALTRSPISPRVLAFLSQESTSDSQDSTPDGDFGDDIGDNSGDDATDLSISTLCKAMWRRLFARTQSVVETTVDRAVETCADVDMGVLQGAVKDVWELCTPDDRKTLLPHESEKFFAVDRVLGSMNASPRVSGAPDDVSRVVHDDLSVRSGDDDSTYETGSEEESERVVGSGPKSSGGGRDEVPVQEPVIPVRRLPGRADGWEPVNPGKVDNAADVKAGLVYAIMAVFHCVVKTIFRARYNRNLPKQDAQEVKKSEAKQKRRLGKTSATHTFKPAHDAYCEMVEKAGIKTGPSKTFQDENYAVVQAIPVWVCNAIETLRSNETCAKEDMFTRTYGKEVKHDSSRTLIDCGKHVALWLLISGFVTFALARHGFLMVVNSSAQRVAMVVTYIESAGGSSVGKNGKEVKSSNQAWHEDFCNAMAGYFQHDFGLSVLVSCLGDSKVDIVRRSYGGRFTKGMKRHRMTVHLTQGQALIMGSGLRHRGCKYNERNVRLFLAFLVGRSICASFNSTYNVQDFSPRTQNGGGGQGGGSKGGGSKG